MPTVPYNPTPNVEPSNRGIPGVNISTPGAAFGTNIAEAIGGIGQKIGAGADMLERQALHVQGLANESAAKDLDVKAMEQIGQAWTEYGTLEGKNAVAAYPDYQKKVEAIRQNILGEATNPEVKRLVDNSIARRVGFAIVDGGRHAATQFKHDQNQTSASRVQMAVQDSAGSDNYNQLQYNLKTIAAETAHQGDLAGASPETVKEATRKAQGQAWQAYLSQLSLKNPILARQVFEQNKDGIDGVHAATIDQHIRTQENAEGTHQVANAILNGQSYVARPGFRSAIESAETGGKPQQISEKGAVGAMQVMPETAKEVAKQLGVEYDPKRLLNDNDYNRKLGTTYLNNMLQRYNGNETLAAAAYNAGPGRVDEWIKRFGDPRSGSITDAEWSSKIPISETKAYVGKVIGGVGERPAPFDPAKGPGQLGPMLTEAKRAAAELKPGDAQFSDMLESRVRQQVNVGVAQYNDNQNANRLMVEATILSGQAKNTPVSIDQITGPDADPKVRAAWEQLDPTRQKLILGYIGTEQKRNTMERETRFREIKGMAGTDEQGLLKVDPLSEDLTIQQRGQVIDLQNKVRRGQNTHLNALRIMNSQASDIIRAAGISHGTPESTEAKQYSRLVDGFSDELDNYSQAHGNKPPDREWIRKTVGGLLRHETKFFGMFQTDPLFQRDVPKEQTDLITEQYIKKFGTTPTKQQVQTMWRGSQVEGFRQGQLTNE